MDSKHKDKSTVLRTLLAAELFSKLAPDQQEKIIVQIKALLSHE